MKKAGSTPYLIRSISELHRLFAISKPDHPLVSVIDFTTLSFDHSDIWSSFTYDFYCIAIKKGASGKFRYGQGDYDFEEGMMSFTQPGQVFSVTEGIGDATGYMLVFKSELIRNHRLGDAIHQYGFFGYSSAEALHLSEKEDITITTLMQQMQHELTNNIDSYSQDVIVSHIELLLSYANRFYNRQFITRRATGHDILSRFEQLVTSYFNDADLLQKGLPSVLYFSAELNLSANYLSDLLRNLTGQSTQQHIHNFVIEKAKSLLATTNLTVSEIAYQLGFEYPQSFNKLFKNKTNITPLAYRLSFN